MKSYLLIVLLFFAGSAQAEIYKWVDGAGNVHYGDQPESSTAKKIQKLPGLSTYSPPPMPEKEPPPEGEVEEGDPEVETEAAPAPDKHVYREISIVSPENGGTVRSSPGTISVFVALAPVLQKGDYLKAILDGSPLEQKFQGTVLRLENVDRGEHRLAVAVFDKSGKKLLQSDTVVFQLHRTIARKRQPRG
ncbi:DUF4124 domain-containing protein [Thiolapillus sp.]